MEKGSQGHVPKVIFAGTFSAIKKRLVASDFRLQRVQVSLQVSSEAD